MSKKNKILQRIAKYTLIFIVFVSLVTPALAVDCTGKDASGNWIPSGCIPPKSDRSTPPLVPDRSTPPPDVKIDMSIDNPLGENVKDLPTFITTILNAVLVVGVPIITLAIIYSGFLFVSARGNPESLTKAKKALVYTIIGAALLLGSFIIANAIKGTVDCIRDNKNTNC